MRKLSTFNFITLNGFVSDKNGDISWHKHGEEENKYALDSIKSGNTLVFGRKTYEFMASYWPTEYALEADPELARAMNDAQKLVFSKTLTNATWNNTEVINEPIVSATKSLKSATGPDLTILGSGSLVTLLAENGLIDEFQIMVDPVALGSGVPLFQNIKTNLDLQLTGFQQFKSGVVLLSYTI